MEPARTRREEEARLRALERYAVLDTPPEPAFDEIASIAASACKTPIALVTLLDRDRQWHKAERGLGLRELPIEQSVCRHAVREQGVFVVEDLAADRRFRDNPLVTSGPCMRFYAGAPILTPEGAAIGAVCVIDQEPRRLPRAKLELLQVLARQAATQLELHAALGALEAARAAARRSERFLRETIDALTHHIAIIDRGGVIAYVNRAWSEFARGNAEPVLLAGLGPGANYLEVCDRAAQLGAPEAVAVAAAIRAALAGPPGGFSTEYPCHSPDERRWFCVRVSAFALDELRYAVVSHDNITARTLAQREVRRLQEERFRAIFETAAVGFSLADPDGTMRQVNPAMAAVAGRDVADLVGTRVQDLVHPDDAPELVRLRGRVLAGELPGALAELRIPRPDGAAWVHWSIAALRGEDGRAAQTLASVLNITQRRLAEHERDRFFRLSRELFAILGFDGTVRRVNPAARRILGFEPRELVGRPFWELVHSDERAAARAGFQRAIDKTGEDFLNLRMHTRDGGVREMRWSAAPWSEEQLIMAVGRDVTAEREAARRERGAYEQLRALAAELQSVREEERTRMSREIHDELGQMLTALKMDITLLEREAGGRLEPQHLAAELRGMSDLVDTTLRSVRRLARELRPEALDTLGLAAAIETHAAEFEERSGVRCRCEVDEALDELPAQAATALFRIVQEALTNVARHARAKEVRVRAVREKRHWRLEVSDDGRGIAGEGGEAPGALGLLGMRERAASIGGELEVHTAPGRGTQVQVRLPAAEEAA